MKKIFTLFIIIILTAGYAMAAQMTKFSGKFIKKFQDCDSYTETVTSEFEGETFTTTRKIIGWENGMCKYQSIISSHKEKYRLDCSFSEMQVEELYNAMKSRSKNTERYTLDLFAPQTDPKTGEIIYKRAGNTIIKGNKAYIAWTKYENNPYFCKPNKL